MSDRKGKNTPGNDTIRDLLGPLDGARIPGGCDHCDAYQTVNPTTAGVWKITVHHDDDCTWFLQH